MSIGWIKGLQILIENIKYFKRQNMKNIFFLIAILFSHSTLSQNFKQTKETIHQFELTNLAGEKFNMSSLKGKKIMIVNTASKCGLTYQYEILEKLYNDFKSENFVIVGFPSIEILLKILSLCSNVPK